MATDPPAGNAPETPGFEAALAELEQLIEQLESGELELAESLERFRRGVELSRQCRTLLDEAQQTVEQVMADDSDPDDPAPASDEAPDG